jgi:Na+/proline symporter
LTRHVVESPSATGDRFSHLPTERTEDALRSYYEVHPDRVAVDVRAFNLQDQAMPQFVSAHFPPGVTGLFLAALMAAIMSSIDSGVHSVTTAFVVDFRDRLFPHLRPERDAQDVLVIRLLIVTIGAIAVTLACFVGPLGDVFDIGKKLTAAFGGPLLAVFILALFFPRARTEGVFAGALLAVGSTLFLMYQRADWFSVWFWPIGFGLAMIISIVGSLLMRIRRAPSDDKPLTFRNIMGF